MFVTENASANEFLSEARKYHKTSVNGWRNRPAIFTTDISYNLLALTIEKYFMAFLISNGDMADNHTFSDMINSYERTAPFPKELAERLLTLEKLQNLCPLADAFSATGLKSEEIEEMILVADEVRNELGYSLNN